jgi:hypothetical protein
MPAVMVYMMEQSHHYYRVIVIIFIQMIRIKDIRSIVNEIQSC